MTVWDWRRGRLMKEFVLGALILVAMEIAETLLYFWSPMEGSDCQLRARLGATRRVSKIVHRRPISLGFVVSWLAPTMLWMQCAQRPRLAAKAAKCASTTLPLTK